MDLNSVIQEIEKVRGGSSANMIELLSNRNTFFCQESDRTKTAYCFGVPIRNIQTNNIVDLRFQHHKRGSTFMGSEAKISIADTASLSNRHGRCDIAFQGSIFKKTEDAVYLNGDDYCMEIHPTLNGLMAIMDCHVAQAQPRLTLRLDRTFESTRASDKYFSVMRDKFTPLITVSCIGAVNAYGKVIAPCEVHNRKCSGTEYVLTFSAICKTKARIAFEINMQETKLFQDTTVESQHPKQNNAFGGISFLGKSKHFGEQWLYERLEISNISQLQGKKILKTILHIPRLGHSDTPLTVNRISTRFCSFGSNWENKIAITDPISESSFSNGYYHLDMTRLFGNLRQKSENFVIRGKAASKPAIIPTGDNFYAPQILEVQYQ